MSAAQIIYERPQQSNVVKLPTAALRKVKQPGLSRKYFRAKAELPRHPANFLSPWQRQALADAVAIGAVDEDALRLIVLAMFKAMSDLDKARVEVLLCPHVTKPHGKAALTLLRYQRGTVGDQSGLAWAFRHIEKNGMPE